MRNPILLIVLTALPLAAPGARAQTAPQVVHAPDAAWEAGSTGSFSLDLSLVTGPRATPDVSDQEVCHNGVGDESCGLYAVLVPTGDTAITGFTPAGPDVRGNLVSPTELRVVRLAAAGTPAGDRGQVALGQLDASRPTSGGVNVDPASRWVRADLVMEPLASSATPLPEPSRGLLRVVGIAALAGLGGRRGRRAPARLAALAGVGLLAAGGARAQVYQDRAGFENAVGGSLEVFDFESVPLAGGYAAFSNGAPLAGGALNWQSLSLGADVALFDETDDPPAPTGLVGTLLVGTDQGSVRGFPGGDGAGGAENDDDFRLDLATPVAAAGLQLHGNMAEAFEAVEFRDASDATLASVAIPDGSGWVGYVATPGQDPIASIVVFEGAGDDDLRFDDVAWASEVSVTSDASGHLPRVRLRAWSELGAEVGVSPSGLEAVDLFGTGVAGVGDVNGDGVPDVAVGAVGDDDGGSARGAVYLFFLERDGSARSVRKISDTQGGLPPGLLQDLDQLGRSLAGLGDLDGDGVPDLAVGAEAFNDPTRTGQVFVLFLRRDGTVKAAQAISEGAGGFAGDLDPGDQFGASLANLGDLDGDGVVDLAVGAQRDEDGGADTGAVWILFLDTDGTVKTHAKLGALSPGLAGALDPGDVFARSLAAIGDLDRDGVPDLAVGAERDDDAGPDRGAVHLLFLDDDGTLKSREKLTTFCCATSDGEPVDPEQDADLAGTALAWIPTPGLATPGVLAVGVRNRESVEPGTATVWGRGAVYFLALKRDGSVADQTGVARTENVGIPEPGLFTPPPGESEGLGALGAAYLGDVDGDGAPDVAVGAMDATVGGAASAGAAYVFLLSGTDPTAFADARVSQTCACPGAMGCEDDRLLGPPDGSGVGLADGTSVTLQLVDDTARGDGTPAGDLVIHRDTTDADPGQTNTLAVLVSEDGGDYDPVFVQAVPEERAAVPIDLDALGFGPEAEIRFVRLVVSDAFADPGLCAGPAAGDPRYDAVEGVANRNLAADADFDGVGDGVDTCPFVPDPGQVDEDSDGVGDACDVCPQVPDPDQRDADGNGFGDACDVGTLRLVEVAALDPTWELRYRCPWSGVAPRIDGGVALPPGATDVTFGGPTPDTACEEPAIELVPSPPPGFVPGDGCVGATEIGPTVDPALSGVLGPGLTGPAGARGDTLYFTLRAVTDLCAANEEVSLGLLHYATASANPALTRQGVGSFGLPPPGIPPDPIVDPVVANLELVLQPAVGEPPGAETRWEMCVRSSTQIHRLSLGLGPPAGTGTADMRWLGCDTAPSGPELERACTAFPAAYSAVATSCPGPFCPSYTLGPDAGDALPEMFVVLEGTTPANDPLVTTLNPLPSQLTCLGQVELATSPGIPPVVSLANLSALPTQPPLVAAIDADFDGVPDANATLDPQEVSVTTAAQTTEDTDGDGLRDESDNCPFLANASQDNTGGLLSTVGDDFIGDGCQCGDTDSDGRMLDAGPDLPLLLDVLLGIETSPAVIDRASVVDGVEVDLRDAVFLQLGLAGKLPAVDPVCEDWALPVPGP